MRVLEPLRVPYRVPTNIPATYEILWAPSHAPSCWLDMVRQVHFPASTSELAWVTSREQGWARASSLHLSRSADGARRRPPSSCNIVQLVLSRIIKNIVTSGLSFSRTIACLISPVLGYLRSGKSNMLITGMYQVLRVGQDLDVSVSILRLCIHRFPTGPGALHILPRL